LHSMDALVNYLMEGHTGDVPTSNSPEQKSGTADSSRLQSAV
jgi:hypothetical protein